MQQNIRLILLFTLLLSMCISSEASDHGDEHRGAANVGDFYVFKRGDKLIMIMTLLADLPVETKRFHFPDDVVYRFMIDRNPNVSFTDQEALKKYGGSILNPEKIREDIIIELKFVNNGVGHYLTANGLKAGTSSNISLFAGIRDEPFIRGGFERRNIASIVLELPLESIISKNDNQTILAWSTTNTTNLHQQTDLGSHPYRSQTLVKLNSLHPSEHLKVLNVPPDVYIYNIKNPAKFPNGRELSDDVVDHFFSNEEIIKRHGSNPSENDVKFLNSFPYLAPAHEFKTGDYPGPPDNKGVYNSSVASFSLEKEANIQGRHARLRYFVVAPFGAFGQHFHDKRPAMVYLLEGTLIETKKEADGKISTREIHANEIFLEPNGVSHWVANPTPYMVKMIVIDIIGTQAVTRVAPGEPRADQFSPPTPTGGDEATAALIEQYDLEKQLPEVEGAKLYSMKASRLMLQPGQRSNIFSSKENPAFSYVVKGNLVEHRSDEVMAIRKPGECSVSTSDILNYWENVTSEPAVVLIVNFEKKK